MLDLYNCRRVQKGHACFLCNSLGLKKGANGANGAKEH